MFTKHPDLNSERLKINNKKSDDIIFAAAAIRK
jgi:hypothetical protein